MKFSIVIPVYNVEKYIEKCLLSILEQDYTDYEIVIVNDGSKDQSGRICDEYAGEHKNVTVIHTPNGGVSKARNTALEKIQGEYVWFIDSDDYIKPGALKRLANYLDKYQGPDMLVFDATVVDEAGNVEGSVSCNLEPGKSVSFRENRELVFANTSLWNRIYKMQVIRDAHLQFQQGITIGEDLLFNYAYLLEAQEIYYERDAFYFYVQRKNSAMSGAGKNKHVQTVFETLIAYYKDQEQYEIYKEEIEYLAIYHYYVVTSVRLIRSGAPKEECLKILKWFQENKIQLSLGNPYVRHMKKKHILVFLLLKFRCYKAIELLMGKL